MKKWIFSCVLVLLTVSLVACNSENAQEVFTRAMEVSEEMDSAEVSMDMNQFLSSPNDSMELEMESKMEAEMILDPIAMYQKGTMNMIMGEETMETETEMYMTEEGLYTYDSMSESWMKMDSELYADLVNMEQQDPAAQLELLEPFMDDVQFEESDDAYTFKFTGEGEEVNEFTEKIMDEYMNSSIIESMGEDISKVLESMTVNKLNYEMVIDKETYETKTFAMDLDMTVTEEGEEMTIAQQINAEYTGINTVDSIEVPQEVIDNAVEMSY